MIIHSLTINNFQSYYDEQEIKFSEGLNLIIGNGGKGKSKLFNAFYWVLFGKIYITSEGWCPTDDLYNSSHKALHQYEFINKKALHDALIDQQVTCTVVLEIEDDKHKSYTIERVASTVRKPCDNWDCVSAWEKPTSSLKVTYDVDLGTKTAVGIMAENLISELFPEGIRGYIWFQGESLDSLIDFRKKQNLRDAVKHISYYPYYEKLTSIISFAKEKIERQETKCLKEANKHNSEVKSLLSIIDVTQRQIALEEDNKRKYESNISQIEIALAEEETKVEGLANYSSLVSEYDACDKEIIRINGELNELDAQERRLLPTAWLLRGIDPYIQKCKEVISSHVKEEYTVPEKKYLDNPSRAKLEEILNVDHKCFVCGSPVDEHHPHAVEWIRERLRMQDEFLKAMDDYRNNMEFSKQFNMFVGRIQDYPDSLLVTLRGIDRQFQNIEDEMEKLVARRKKKLDKKRELDDRIEEIKQKHGVDPRREVVSATNLSRSIKASRTELDKQKRLLQSSTNAISDYKDKLRYAEKELASMGHSTGTITSVPETEWKNITTFLESVCKNVQERVRKELLKSISTRSNEFYEKFTEHDNGYKGRVEISEDYAITFDAGLNTSHEDRKKMSIINALLSLNQDAIGTYYPFISDAPTSSFDPSTTHKYLMGIKDIFGQSIIMTKDVEIGSDKYDDLVKQNKVTRIYELQSKIHTTEDKEPEIFEVSTIVEPLK